jgi:chromosome segregation ATPase
MQQGWSHSVSSIPGSAPDFNMLMSETRMQNTEMRMAMQRVTDKVDQVLTNQMTNRNVPVRTDDISIADIKHELDRIKEQNTEIKNHLIQKQIGEAGSEADTTHTPMKHIARTEQLSKWQEENETKQTKLDSYAHKLEQIENKLKEKEAQLQEISRSHDEEIQSVQEKLDTARSDADAMKEYARKEIRSELKKIMSSTSKVLHSQFSPDEEYSGETVQDVLADRLREITARILGKYDTDSVSQVSKIVPMNQQEGQRAKQMNQQQGGQLAEPTNATVTPRTTNTDDDNTSGDEEWQEDDQ